MSTQDRLQIINFIGESSSEADRKRVYRSKIENEKISIGTNVRTNVPQILDKCPDKCLDKNPPEIEIELEKEIDLDLKNKYCKSDALQTDSKAKIKIDFEQIKE